MKTAWLFLVFLVPAFGGEVDFEAVSRVIEKEPAYVAEPRYALFLFGPAGKTRMCAVADKSKADLAYYDVLYFDLDADGDLTEEREKFTAEYNPAGERAGVAISLRIPRIEVPGTGIVHTGFRLSTVPKAKRGGFWFQLKWNGKTEISGGYAAVGTNTTRWGESAAAAPVFRPTTRGRLAFALYAWGADRVTLKIGASPKVYIMVGNRGSGPHTLAALDEDFLDLTKDVLTATLVAKDAAGKDVVSKARITAHC